MPDHKIEKMAVHLVDIPAKAVHSHGSGDVASIRSVILELITDSGISGFGEASPWPVFTGTAEASASALHDHMRTHLIGENPIRVEMLMHRMERVIVGHPEAKAALETALLDITGQIAGLPIAELMGGRQRHSIAMSFSIANPDFNADLEDIERLFADGVRLFKVKTASTRTPSTGCGWKSSGSALARKSIFGSTTIRGWLLSTRSGPCAIWNRSPHLHRTAGSHA